MARPNKEVVSVIAENRPTFQPVLPAHPEQQYLLGTSKYRLESKRPPMAVAEHLPDFDFRNNAQKFLNLDTTPRPSTGGDRTEVLGRVASRPIDAYLDIENNTGDGTKFK